MREALSIRISRAISIMAAALALSSCGFHLRGEATYAFQTIYVNGAGAPGVATELRRALTVA